MGTATLVAVLAGVDWEVVRQAAVGQGDKSFLGSTTTGTCVYGQLLLLSWSRPFEAAPWIFPPFRRGEVG